MRKMNMERLGLRAIGRGRGRHGKRAAQRTPMENQRHARRFSLACLMTLCLCLPARADVYIDRTPPEDWAQRPLLRIIAIDANRNDAMLLTCQGEAMLVDSADGCSLAAICAAADAQQVTSFKYLFSTHSDTDHIWGFPGLVHEEGYAFGEFLSPNPEHYRDKERNHERVTYALRKLEIPYRQLEDGELLTLGGASLRVMRCMENLGANARSAALYISYGESRALLTADAESAAMRYYADQYGADGQLRADIMKAPHHGINALPAEFAEAVSPELIFVTNLERNVPRYRGRVRQALPEAGLMFCGEGSVVMETDGENWYGWQLPNTQLPTAEDLVR